MKISTRQKTEKKIDSRKRCRECESWELLDQDIIQLETLSSFWVSRECIGVVIFDRLDTNIFTIAYFTLTVCGTSCDETCYLIAALDSSSGPIYFEKLQLVMTSWVIQTRHGFCLVVRENPRWHTAPSRHMTRQAIILMSFHSKVYEKYTNSLTVIPLWVRSLQNDPPYFSLLWRRILLKPSSSLSFCELGS